MPATYSIGEVASRFRLSPSALRYYESLGLLAEPLRVSGRRRYDDAALDRLAMIDVAQRAGFSLREARVLLDGLHAGTPPTEQWRELARRKVAEIDELVVRAEATRRLLHTLLDCDCLELEDIAAFRRANREWVRADRGADTAESGRPPRPVSSSLAAVPEPLLTGACLCGGVRFAVDQPPLGASYCHCTRCQRRTGTAASAQAQLAPGSLRILEGAELVREWIPEQGFAKAFCSVCGSALFSRAPGGDHPYSVRLGVLDPGHGIRPAFRQFVTYAAEWEAIPDDGLERFPERRP